MGVNVQENAQSPVPRDALQNTGIDAGTCSSGDIGMPKFMNGMPVLLKHSSKHIVASQNMSVTRCEHEIMSEKLTPLQHSHNQGCQRYGSC